MKKKSSSLLIILILLVLAAGFYWYGSGNLQGSYESARVGMPDLVVDSISKDSVGRVSISLTNKGTVDTPAKGLIAVFQDATTKPKWSYNWQDLTKETMLKAGASTTLTLNTLKAEGAYDLKVCADYVGKLVESDETNNCATSTLFVMPTYSDSFSLSRCNFIGGYQAPNSKDTSASVDGSSCSVVGTSSEGGVAFEIFSNGMTDERLDDYSYVSFWVSLKQVSAGKDLLAPDSMYVATGTGSGHGDFYNSTDLTSSFFVGSPSYITPGDGVPGHWYFVKDVPMPAETDDEDASIGILWDDNARFTLQDTLYIDGLTVYNK